MKLTALQQRLNTVNGRRRARTLSLADIVEAADQLKPGEHVFLHGGHVANSYRYPAVATGAVVFIPAGRVSARVLLQVVSASKGATGFGRHDQWTPIGLVDDTDLAPWVTRQDRALVYRTELLPHFETLPPWDVAADWWDDHHEPRKAKVCRLMAK